MTNSDSLSGVERISIRRFTTLLFFLVVVIAIVTFYLSSGYVRDVALHLQKQSLSRVVEVAANGAMLDLRKKLVAAGSSLQLRPELRNALKSFYQSGNDQALQQQVDDPMINGFAGFGEIELVKLRVYDKNHRFVAQTSRGLDGLQQNLPDFMDSVVSKRSGADRLKVVDGLWTETQGKRVLYSLMLPIGGLRSLGYLELVVDPVFNLLDVSKLMQKTLYISDINGIEVGRQEHIGSHDISHYEEIEYLMKDADGKPLLKLVILDDISKFDRDMHFTLMTTIGVFALIAIILLVGGLVIMRQFLFKPINHMIGQMQAISDGDLSIEVNNHGLKEFHYLANNFNRMKGIVRNSMKDLEKISLMDSLSGLANRRHFDHSLELVWQRFIRQQKPFSLVLCDIDYFKRYNDTYGHTMGDQCIQFVAQALISVTDRPRDLACRYGGEEFAIILPETPLAGAEVVVQRLQEAIKDLDIPHQGSEISDQITLSIGIVAVPASFIHDKEEMINAADQALYKAKEKGRNNYQIAGR